MSRETKKQLRFTIEDMVQIRDSRHLVTKERYIYYAQLQFLKTEREASGLYEEYFKFPFFHVKSAESLEIALWIYNHLSCASLPEKNKQWSKTSDSKRLKVKVFYIKDGRLSNVEIDLHSYVDVQDYAKIIEKHEIVSVCEWVDDYYSNSKTINIYEGDVFDTHDQFWNNKKGNVYCVMNGKIRRLLYTKGKGYLHGDKINIDGDGSYTSYACCGKNSTYLGNINVDYNFLKDE